MMSNIDKDIHMLKSYAGMTHKLTDNQGRPKLDQAIENVLEELEIKDKMIDEMAEKIFRDITDKKMKKAYGIDSKEDVKKMYFNILDEEF